MCVCVLFVALKWWHYFYGSHRIRLYTMKESIRRSTYNCFIAICSEEKYWSSNFSTKNWVIFYLPFFFFFCAGLISLASKHPLWKRVTAQRIGNWVCSPNCQLAMQEQVRQYQALILISPRLWPWWDKPPGAGVMLTFAWLWDVLCVPKA